MNGWYKIEFPLIELQAMGAARKLQRLYEQLLMAKGAPLDALLLASDEHGVQHQDYYFSPGAMRIAAQVILQFGAKPCDDPDLKTVQLVVGDESALDRLREEQVSK